MPKTIPELVQTGDACLTLGFRRVVGILLVAAVFGVLPVAAAEKDDRDATEFFERRVRPVLVEHCLKCHGSEKQESGLRIDSRQRLLQGGKRGAAVVAGKPEQSLLIQAVRRRGKMKMPPSASLTRNEVSALENWIRLGAPWPKTAPRLSTGSEPSDREARIRNLRESHWAFQPVRNVNPPTVRDSKRLRNEIDRFVLSRLEKEGLTPSPRAERRTLIRRLFFDLIGLPPAFEQVEAFAADKSAGAYERLVDELLARPEYGQRWARHWLDVARYSDTTGYQESAEPRFPFAWTYRDYVVRSFNEDTPFNEFVFEQLAADQLPLPPDRQWKLAALGFLTVGPRFNYNRHEIIDDRIDVVTRGFLALTVTCARCHDHKYDPLITDDYYGLYGVFASSREPLYADLPRIGTSRGEFKHYREFRTKAARATRNLEQFHQRVQRRIQHEMRARAGDYLRYLVQLMPKHRTVAQRSFETKRGLVRGPTPYGPGAIVRWRHYIKSCGSDDPVFGVWNRLAALTREEFAAQSNEVIQQFGHLNSQLREALLEKPLNSMLEAAGIYGQVLEKVYADWAEHREADPEAERFADAASEQLREVLYVDDSPIAMTVDAAHDCYTDGEFNRYMGLKRECDSLFVEYRDVAAPRAMVLADRDILHEPRVFVRGNSTRPGRWVPRQFLRLFPDIDGGKCFSDGSGRLELAQAIVHARNPLTARVIVNRCWQWHFGKGLVETASDFGIRGTAPSHPHLLDWLTTDFVEHGWSLKRLHRLIVTSAAYRQNSLKPQGGLRNAEPAPDPALRNPQSIDPENQLLWRAHRRRLKFEAMRDAMYSVAEILDHRRGGPPQNDFDSRRRTLYLLVDRHDLPGVFATFDFPSPDISNSKRPETTIPQQALFLMNNEFVDRISAKLVARLLADASVRDESAERIDWLYRRILSRSATAREMTLCSEFLRTPERRSKSNSSPVKIETSKWRDLVHTLLMSNEFLFVY